MPMTVEEILKKYPSPKKDKNFKKRWDILVPEIVERPNFKPSHLFQLEILCDVYVSYEYFNKIVNEQGPTVHQEGGRYGEQIKIRPEVSLLTKLKVEIVHYNKMLGLLLMKDTKQTVEDEIQEEWE